LQGLCNCIASLKEALIPGDKVATAIFLGFENMEEIAGDIL